ncbi:MAG: ABC transporter ATP-binding protein [bacterium]
MSDYVSTVPLLQAEGIGFRYDRPVIQDFDLSIAAGEFVAVVGPSGCGKTTLMKLLAGFLPPTEGTLLWHGTPLQGPSPERVVVFQEFDQLFPWKRVWANVEFPLKHGGISSVRLPDRRARSRRVEAMLQEVGLSQASGRFPYQLSGGMKQRTALARALVCRPDMLLMDEPFGSLDAQKREELQELLLRMWREHQFAAVFVTHDISEALYLADRVVVLPQAGGSEYTQIPVELPRPRDRSSADFRDYYRRIYGLL